jgi:hypothetical protein
MHRLIVSRPKNDSPIGRALIHDEQFEARVRRNRRNRPRTVNRRRPVIGLVSPLCRASRIGIQTDNFRQGRIPAGVSLPYFTPPPDLRDCRHRNGPQPEATALTSGEKWLMISRGS